MERPGLIGDAAADFIRRRYKKQVIILDRLPSYEDTNVLVTEADTEIKYILKIFSIEYNEATRSITEQRAECVHHLVQHGFCCTQYVAGVDGCYVQKFEASGKESRESASTSHPALLSTFLSGGELENNADINHPVIIFELGLLLGYLHKAMEDMLHEGLEPEPDNPWQMCNIHILGGQEYLYVVEDDTQRQILKQIIEDTAGILNSSGRVLKKGILHGDFHGLNLIVEENFRTESRLAEFKSYIMHRFDGTVRDLLQPERALDKDMTLQECLQIIREKNKEICSKEVIQKYGLIDFGEMCYSYQVLEVGRVIVDLMTTVLSKSKAISAQEVYKVVKEHSYTHKQLACDCRSGHNVSACNDLLGDCVTSDCCHEEASSEARIYGENLRQESECTTHQAQTSEIALTSDTRERLHDLSGIMKIGGYILSGYFTANSLSAEEVNLMKAAMMVSLVQYFVLGKKSMIEDPDNSEYSGQGSVEAEMLLWELHGMDTQELYSIWAKAAASLLDGKLDMLNFR